MTGGEQASYTLRDIAVRFGGEVIGDPQTRVTQVASLENATPDAVAFLANERYLQQLRMTRAGAVILGSALRDETPLPRIVCDNPYAYFARVSALLNPPRAPVPGAHASAVVDGSAALEADVEIGALAVVGRNATIGAGSIVGPGCIIGDEAVLGRAVRLYPNVTIYHGCRVGDRTIVHAGAVIGADGFGIAMSDERWVKIPQIGRVVIGVDVEIGANTTIDRGAIDDTIIEDGVKLDNQIQVGHNVRIGAHTAIAACVGIAGSSRVGRYCRIGGASGIAGHLSIADHVEISAHTLITKSIDRPGTYTGAYPFDANSDWRRNAAQLRHLGELADRVRVLEKKLAAKERSQS
ncbi:MAG: UDP-3-O-(3-hydroxymyristoyl)glucosamine N-acyltransferase [Betaproteobacteria bacterium RIFCSPLOWO2_02_64_14]|nr:MAG: UDP-3-O-(3-hydroxymyristoyl)glucosamine N-acyltransferase [Betaproteobacteria bacterium RIFCSPLOWO2_02_64_14]